MKIKEIKLYGFKSFQEETKFLLNPGITAFVGPNGSGKSNIFDALRWVFGEQSMKALRCEKNEDLIHISADGQSDSNFAEVTVTIDNEDYFPQFGSEFEIKRRYYRDGESEFYLNRVKCRLQDIQALFLNSGALTYSFLELSEIEKIISGDTKDMFDDVAGILKYQERREQTKRRLEQTEQDLLRLEDVINEMERTVRSLKRQARQTQLYQELKEEYKRLSLFIAKKEYEKVISGLNAYETHLSELNRKKQDLLVKLNHLDEERKHLKNELQSLDIKKKEFVNEINKLNLEIEELQQKLVHLENESRQFTLELERKTASLKEKQEYLKILKNKITENELKISEVESELNVWYDKLKIEQEKIENLSRNYVETTQMIGEKQKILDGGMFKIQLLKNDLARLEINKANKETIAGQLNKEKEELVLTLSTLVEEETKLERELDMIIKEQDNISSIILEHQRTSSEIEEKIKGIEKELQKRQEELNDCRLLIDTLSSRLGKNENIKFMKQRFKERLLGVFRNYISVLPGYESVVDLCLYEILNFFLVNDINAEDFINLPEGRYGFIIKTNFSGNIPEELQKLKNITDIVEVKGNNEYLSAILSRFYLASSFEEGLFYASKFPGYGFATSEGVLFYNNVITIQKGEFGYFQISQKMNEYQSKVESLQNEIVFLNDEKRKLLEQQEQTKADLEKSREQLFSLNIKKSEISMKLSTLKNRLNNLNREIDELTKEIHNTTGEIDRINTSLNELALQINDEEKDIARTRSEREELESNLKELERKIDDQNKELNQIILKIGILNELKSVAEKNAQDTRNEISNLQKEIEEITRLSEDEMGKIIEKQIEELKEMITTKKEQRAHLEIQIPEESIQAISRKLDIIYDEIAQLQKQQDEIQNEIMQINFQIFELNHKKEELIKKAREEFQTNLEEYTPEEIPEPEQRLNEIKERLARLGEINPLSLSAYEQEKKRLDEYIAQRNDIIAAKQNLLKSIAELDARARERFIDTFKQIKEKFNEVFSKFFEGGEADLILTDPSNPLTSEVDIVVRMKGKRIKRINQLSGGERTLLAVSLLLAFYLVKPAPFCILDEIDAPLDDVNVVRFNKFLRELSQHTQVVIITHNRATMEFADYLYGLTMERPGKSKIVSTRLEDLEPVEVAEQ
ncbi:MAG: chromosome segregation protein SMC [candidate division WOR-3 bacterium]|nr:chromosome segregation protein SMC [candidate division WOR-3 bacterium]